MKTPGRPTATLPALIPALITALTAGRLARTLMTTVPAAVGAGFYRYWHVPAPDAGIGIADTRRADRSVIGPAALVVLAVGAALVGRVGAAVLLDQPLSVPVGALPLTSRLLVLTGAVGLGLAALWWLATVPLRARVAGGVAAGTVARIPDDPPVAGESLHTAVTHLGRTLRDVPEASPQAEPAFDVLRTATTALTSRPDVEAVVQARRLRRRCLTMAQRVERAAADVPERPSPEHAAA